MNLEQDNYNFNFTLKSIGKHFQQKKCTKIYDIFYLLHRSTYVELNKICFIIFRFFYELICIYQFSADLKNKKKSKLKILGTLEKCLFFFSLSTDSGWAVCADR